MQKWEYLIIELGGVSRGIIDIQALWNILKAPRFVNGQELRDWKTVSLPTYIKQLGEDGWEMTGTLSGGAGLGYGELFFKRPKS